MRIILVPHKFESLAMESAEGPVAEFFREYIEPCPVGPKDGQGACFAVLVPCPTPCRNAAVGDRVDCGGGQYHRLAANTVAVTALGVDLDSLKLGDLGKIISRLQGRGLEFIYWETWSSTPEAPRARLLFPFAEEMPINSPAAWSKGAWPALVDSLGLKDIATADHAARDAARIFYLPRRPDAASTRACGYIPGKPLDWRPIVGDGLGAFPSLESVRVPPAAVPDLGRPVDLEAIKTRLAAAKYPAAQNLAKGKALSPPPHLRKHGEPSRYEAWRSATATLSMILDGWESDAALLELLRPSWNAEAMEDPADHTPWGTVLTLLERARESAPRRKAEKEAERVAAEAFWKKVLARVPRAASEGAPGAGPPGPGAGPPADWTAELDLTDPDRDGKAHVKKSLHNLNTILAAHPSLAGTMRRNAISRDIDLLPPNPILEGGSRRVMRDSDCSLLRLWMAREGSIGLEFSHEEVTRQVEAIADANEYDPLMDYLRGARAGWDGKDRLGRFLETYFGASLVNEDGLDRSQYVRAVGKKWMIAAVARGLQPGCKADNCLVFEGLQGKGKTSSLEILGGQWYVNFAYNIESKDAQEAAGSRWIGELGELSAMGRSTVSAIKNFLTIREDVFRPAYGRLKVCRPRRLILAGTTNDLEYLSDPTGNRRFWPVACTQADVDRLAKDRDQLWGEAVARLEAGEQWWLTPEEESLAAAEALPRMKADPLEDRIVDWFAMKEPASRPAEVRVTDMVAALFDRPTDRITETRVGMALAKLGFRKERRTVHGHRTWVCVTPVTLMGAPRKTKTVQMGAGGLA